MQLPFDPTTRELKIAFETLVTDFTRLRAEIDKQAIEYERRLTGLNHENERLSVANNANVARGTYEAERNATLDRVAKLELSGSNLQGRMWAIGAVITIANAVFYFFKH